MIPILYQGTEQTFTSNGLGRLSDAISCTVTEERNGQFELEMAYPISGIHYNDIQENRIIMAKTEDGGTNQAFIIYKITRPLNGVVTIYAQHISYLLCGFVVMPFTAGSCAETFSRISDNMVIQTPFTFNTDVVSAVSFRLETARSVRNLLGGESGSILDTYGGYDYKFDNFSVYLYSDRGNDNGVTLRYGKNITALKNAIDTTNVYTAIVPYWQDTEGNSLYLSEKIVYSEHASDYPYAIIKTVDFSNDFETMPTEAQLRAKAVNYLATKYGWKLKNSIDISFVNLAQTEEYKDLVALERVRMCDTVTVIYEKLGVNIKTKVIKTVYNVLTEKYDSISLGDTTYTLAKAIQEAIDIPTQTETNSAIQAAVSRATKLIQGGLGGHIVFTTDGNGEPQEILIMDTDNINTAVNVIRMNLNGIGFSHNGYEGPFETAWTIDGHFVANFIDTGALDGGIIKAGSLEVNALSDDAMDDLGQIHNYMPYDMMSNINRWNVPSTASSAVSRYYDTITIDGVNKTCLRLNATGLSAYALANRCYVWSDIIGMPTMHIKFKYRFTQSKSITSQRFGYISFYDTSGTRRTRELNTVSGSVVSGVDYSYDSTITLSMASDINYSNPEIGFAFVAGEDVLIYDIEVTGNQQNYNGAAMVVDANGLSSVVHSGAIISSINQTAEAVTIKASKIDLSGNLSLKGDFVANSTQYSSVRAEVKDGEVAIYRGTDKLAEFMRITSKNNLCGAVALYDVDGSLTSRITGNSALLRDTIISQLTVNGDSQFYGDVLNRTGGVEFVSDRRKKRSIKDLAITKARSFIMGLKPVRYKFTKDISKSDRYHHGFIAQDVKEAMPDDWGIYVENQEKDFIGLRYDEFIADMVAVIQDQQKRIEALERAQHDNSDI